jgi:hypothetical protein
MWIRQHKIQSLILFIAAILFIFLMAISFWNPIRNKHVDLGGWPLVFLLLNIIIVSLFYLVFRKATNERITELRIQEKVAEERAKIMGELNNKENVAKTDENVEIDVNELAGKIVPRGNVKTIESFCSKLLINLASELQIVLGIVFTGKGKGNTFTYLSGFALPADVKPADFKAGENLSGQVAENKELLILRDLPEQYFNVESGLGKSKPKNLIITPIVNNNKTIAIIELATFIDIDKNIELLVQKVSSLAAEKMAQF